MPQEGSGSAAPMDPAAIEAVRATSSSRKQPLASPERPVTPYDRRVVSHDASRPTPSSRSPLAREPFEGEGTSPPRRGARSSATHGAMASSSAAHLAAMTHGDAWPPPLEGERARDPSRASAETERPTSVFSPFPESPETRAESETASDASVVVYSLDGTVSTVRVPPVAKRSPGDQSRTTPSDRALQGLGSRLGAKKHALPLGRLPLSRPVTGERGRSRPSTKEGGRVTASDVNNAMAGGRAAVVESDGDGDESDGAETASRDVEATFPKSSEPFSDAFPEPERGAAAFAFGGDDSDASFASDESDDEPTETLAMARERARHEERASAEKAAADQNAETRRRRDDDSGDDDASSPPPPPPRPESRPESRVLDFATDAPRLRMATLAPGPAPRPVSREAGRMPPPAPRLPKKEASPLSPLKPPLRAAANPAPANPAPAASEDASPSPARDTPPRRDEKKEKRKSPLEEELEAWGVSLPVSPTSAKKDGGSDGDLVAVDDEDDDLLAFCAADDFASAASESSAPFGPPRLGIVGAPPVLSGSFRDSIPESPLVTSPLEDRERLVSSPLLASPKEELVGEKEEARTFGVASGRTNLSSSPPRDARSGSSADENAPLSPRDARRVASASADARETDGLLIGDDDDAESLAWLRKTSRDAEHAARRMKIPPSGAERAGDEHSGVLRETPLRAETVAAYGAASVRDRSRASRRKSKIPPPPSPSLRRESSALGVDAEAERLESVEGKSAAREKRSARRVANPKSRLPPPPTRLLDGDSKAPAKAPASSKRVSSVAGPGEPAKSAGTRLASTTAAGYSAGAAGGTEKARKPTKPKNGSASLPTPPAARPASEAPSDAPSEVPSDAPNASATPIPPEPEERRRRTERSADPGSVPVPTNAPAPKKSATPAEPSTDSPAMTLPPAMTKAEEARARLRGSRQRRSIAGVASSVASSVAASSAAAAPAAPPAAAAAPPKPAGAEWGSDPAAAAAAAAASKLASKLGSVSVMKPRGSSVSNTSAAEKKTAKAERRAADAARRAEHAAAFAKAAAEAEAAKLAAVKAAKEAAAREAEHRVAGVDEAEMVLRVGSLADEKTLLGARQAVHRMRLLLDDVTRLSKELKCEPQHVYGHVLHRLGFPVDRESRELPLERLVGLERAREMCAGVSEIRNLLRIKVQDNNDLRLAQTALCETTNFFERLDAFAAKKNKTPSEVLAAQANGGKA